jgi:hypothetical protein
MVKIALRATEDQPLLGFKRPEVHDLNSKEKAGINPASSFGLGEKI